MVIGDSRFNHTTLGGAQRSQLEFSRMDMSSYPDSQHSLTVNVTSIMDEDPEVLDASDLFSAFHYTWHDSHCSQLDLPARFSELCSAAMRRLPKQAFRPSSGAFINSSLSDIRNTFDVLQAEKDTWTLIAALYADRFDPELHNTHDENGRDEFTAVQHSEREIIRLLYAKDSGIRETQMVIDWLERRVREQIEEVAEKYECLFNQTIGWENTAHAIEYLSEKELSAKKLISTLHPDALFTSPGCQLEAKDQVEEERYLNYLFLCIRGGDLQRAQRLCMQRGEFWRAMSFEGWRPFHCADLLLDSSIGKAFSAMDHDSSATLDALPMACTDVFNQSGVNKRDTGDVVAGSVGPEGNPTRVLFKSVCWWNAENTSLSVHERAIYAAMSGNLPVMVRLLPASWTDLAWAHCRAVVEARVASSLRHLLNTGPRADTLSVLGRSFERWSSYPGGSLQLPDSAEEFGDWSLAQVFTRVEAHLGWSALGQLQAMSGGDAGVPPLEGVRRSALFDFLNEPGGRGACSGSTASTVSARGIHTASGSRRDASAEPSIAVLLHCIFYAVQQAVALRDYDLFMASLAKVMPQLTAVALGLSSHVFLVNAETGCLLPPNLSEVGSLARKSGDLTVCHLLRFLSHLMLFLQAVEPDLQTEHSSQVVKAYLSYLMFHRRTELIADYTATLPSASLRIQWYSSLLAEVSQPEEREACLRHASSAGFEIPRLTRAVVCLLNQRHGDSLLGHQLTRQLAPIPSGLLTAGDQGLGKLTDKDRKRILAMEWLFYEPSQRGEALVVVNSLLRVFIAMNCLPAAHHVLSKLPPGTLSHAKLICHNSGSPLWLVNGIREHECLLLYLESRECFVDWFKQVHSNRPVPPTLNETVSDGLQAIGRSFTHRLQVDEAKKAYEARLQRWRHEVRLDSQVAAEKLLSLLTYSQPGWLVDLTSLPSSSAAAVGLLPDQAVDPEIGPVDPVEAAPPTIDSLAPGLGESQVCRQQQLTVLREICLPDTVFLLLRLYQTAGMHTRCVDMANLVVAKEHGLFREVSVDLAKRGWVVCQKFITDNVKKNAVPNINQLTSLLLNTDLRESGAGWFADTKNQNVLEADGRVVQIVRIRNIAVPEADEDTFHGTKSTDHLLRLTLTDGRTSLSALDMDNCDQLSKPSSVCPDLSMDTPPGTKLRLSGSIVVSHGFLLLFKGQATVLGGEVLSLVREWTMTKQAKASHGRVYKSGGPPPFVPFGSREAAALIQVEVRFLSALRRPSGEAFDSFKIASSAGSSEKTNEFDAGFNERRQEVIQEVKHSTTTTVVNGSSNVSQRAVSKFQAGGSKFANLLAEKSQQQDESLAHLLSMGYQLRTAQAALRMHKGDCKAALDHLMAKSVSDLAVGQEAAAEPLRRGSAGRGPGRRGGGRRGGGRRGGYDPAEEDDPRFDPAMAAAAAGLPSRPSSGLVSLTDLLPATAGFRANTNSHSSYNSYTAQRGGSVGQPKAGPSEAVRQGDQLQLPIGCPILAQNMSGDYEEAQLIGHVTTPGGDKVVLVVYSAHGQPDNEEEEELVPLSLLRTLNKQRLTLDMIPAAPASRSKVYAVNQSSVTFGHYSDTGGERYRRPFSSRAGRASGRRGFAGGRRGPFRGRGGRQW